MQTSIFNDSDEYSKCIIDIRNQIGLLEGDACDEEEELTPELAATYSQEIIAYIKKLGAPCECNRWKSLYQR
jgi:hypothetical protein